MTEIHSGTYLSAYGMNKTRFKYDESGRFIGWLKLNKANNEGEYEIKYKYDENGRPESSRMRNGLTMNFSYFNDGTLKETNMSLKDSFYFGKVKKTKMEYNEKGQLVKMQSMHSSNRLIQDGFNIYSLVYPSVSTFEYNEDGLCTRKYEEVFFIDRRMNDTLKIMPCDNIFTYNEKGDLASWTYTGGSYYTDNETHITAKIGLKSISVPGNSK